MKATSSLNYNLTAYFLKSLNLLSQYNDLLHKQNLHISIQAFAVKQRYVQQHTSQITNVPQNKKD